MNNENDNEAISDALVGRADPGPLSRRAFHAFRLLNTTKTYLVEIDDDDRQSEVLDESVNVCNTMATYMAGRGCTIAVKKMERKQRHSACWLGTTWAEGREECTKDIFRDAIRHVQTGAMYAQSNVGDAVPNVLLPRADRMDLDEPESDSNTVDKSDNPTKDESEGPQQYEWDSSKIKDLGRDYHSDCATGHVQVRSFQIQALSEDPTVCDQIANHLRKGTQQKGKKHPTPDCVVYLVHDQGPFTQHRRPWYEERQEYGEPVLTKGRYCRLYTNPQCRKTAAQGPILLATGATKECRSSDLSKHTSLPKDPAFDEDWSDHDYSDSE